MKLQSYALFGAALLTAAVLGACQKNGGNTAPVRDGRSAAAKAGKGAQKLEALNIKCQGTIDVDGVVSPIDTKAVVWDQRTPKMVPLIEKLNVNNEGGQFVLQLVPATKESLALMVLSANQIEKDKNVHVAGILQTNVRLYVEHAGQKAVKMNVICGVDSGTVAMTPIKVNADKKIEVDCNGSLETKEGSQPFHEGAEKMLVGAAQGEKLSYKDLSLGKSVVNATLDIGAELSTDLSKANASITLVSADKKLKVLAEVKNDIAIKFQVSSDLEKQALNYKCLRNDGTAQATDNSTTSTTVPAKADTAITDDGNDIPATGVDLKPNVSMPDTKILVDDEITVTTTSTTRPTEAQTSEFTLPVDVTK